MVQVPSCSLPPRIPVAPTCCFSDATGQGQRFSGHPAVVRQASSVLLSVGFRASRAPWCPGASLVLPCMWSVSQPSCSAVPGWRPQPRRAAQSGGSWHPEHLREPCASLRPAPRQPPPSPERKLKEDRSDGASPGGWPPPPPATGLRPHHSSVL